MNVLRQSLGRIESLDRSATYKGDKEGKEGRPRGGRKASKQFASRHIRLCPAPQPERRHFVCLHTDSNSRYEGHLTSS